MADVAKAAGISTALVSIVMRGVPGASDATRERVQRIADELGYVPDERARKLRQSRSRVLGVAFELQQPFHGDLVERLYAAASAASCSFAFTTVCWELARVTTFAPCTASRSRCRSAAIGSLDICRTRRSRKSAARRRPRRLHVASKTWRQLPAVRRARITNCRRSSRILKTTQITSRGLRSSAATLGRKRATIKRR